MRAAVHARDHASFAADSGRRAPSNTSLWGWNSPRRALPGSSRWCMCFWPLASREGQRDRDIVEELFVGLHIQVRVALLTVAALTRGVRCSWPRQRLHGA